MLSQPACCADIPSCICPDHCTPSGPSVVHLTRPVPTDVACGRPRISCSVFLHSDWPRVSTLRLSFAYFEPVQPTAFSTSTAFTSMMERSESGRASFHPSSLHGINHNVYLAAVRQQRPRSRRTMPSGKVAAGCSPVGVTSQTMTGTTIGWTSCDCTAQTVEPWF
jgi:hypothetical protein